MLGVGLLVVVAACDGGAVPPSDPDPGPSTSAPASTETTPPAAGSPGDVGSTTSTAPPAGGSVTAEAIRRDVAEVVPTLQPPDGEQIVEGSLEYFEWVASCAEALGAVAAVSTSPPAIFPGEGPSNRRDALVIPACADAASDQPWFVPYPFDGSREARAVEYDLKLQIHRCLEDHSYPTVEPPSKEAYVAGEEWNPYEAMGRGTPLYVSPFLDAPPGASEQLEAQQTCGASLAQAYQEQVLEADEP